SYYIRPHNDFLWVLSEIGILGFLCFLSIFGTIFYYIFKIISYSTSSQDKMFAVIMCFGIVGYLVISSFSFPIERIEHNIYLMLIMASLISIYHKSAPKKEYIKPAKVFLFTFSALILLLFSMVIGIKRLNAEIHTRKALIARESNNWGLVKSEINKAYNIFYTMDPTSIPLPWYRGVAEFSSNNIIDALSSFEIAYQISPYNVQVLNNLATCYEMSGEHEKAIDFYKKTLEVSPRFIDAIINLSAVYYNRGKYKEAYELLIKYKLKTYPAEDEYVKIVQNKINSYLEIVINKLDSIKFNNVQK
ncbi:tetratricopeptide repeat protein, partial [Candidatus Amoebophilus asiaticus]|nr:tetratricopeptide repeat protein [Candidatus Amoebophilus asiaticus]